MPVVVQCNSCKKKIKAADKFAGKRVKCPGCQSVLTIPALASAAAASSPAAASAASAPKPLTPTPNAAASSLLDDEIPIRQEDLPPQPAANSLADMLDDDIPIRQEPVTKPVVPAQPVGGVGLGAADGVKKKKRRPVSSDSSAMIDLLRGCGISAISVLIGVVIWYGIAMLTGFELGIIAWMLGGAAGVGMAVGCGDGRTNAITGLLAALITFMGIFVARFAIVLTIIIPMFAAAANAPDEFFDEEFMEEEFGDEMAFDDMEMAAAAGAEEGDDVPEGEAAAGSSDAELDAEMAAAQEEAREAIEAAVEEAMAEEDFGADEMPEIGLGGVIIGFFAFAGLLMFGGVYQAIFTILACATAFRVGMTGVVDEE